MSRRRISSESGQVGGLGASGQVLVVAIQPVCQAATRVVFQGKPCDLFGNRVFHEAGFGLHDTQHPLHGGV
jgi:hypothetical protein